MINPIFKGTIKQGRFVPDDPRKFSQFLCAREGKTVECVIRPESKVRSVKQNNYYWGVIIPIIAESTGYDEDSTHEALKEKFNPRETIFGVDKPISTTKMTTIQTEERNTKIREWASGFLGCYVPKPNEVTYE